MAFDILCDDYYARIYIYLTNVFVLSTCRVSASHQWCGVLISL